MTFLPDSLVFFLSTTHLGLFQQAGTNFEIELSSMRKLIKNDQHDRRKKVFYSLMTDDIAHNCKTESIL